MPLDLIQAADDSCGVFYIKNVCILGVLHRENQKLQKYVNKLHFTSTNQHVQPLNHSALCKLIFAHAVMIGVTFAYAQAATPS